MDRSRGVELGSVWPEMSWEERFEVVETLVEYEKAYASGNLPMYGSLYYAKDIPSLDPCQYLDSASSRAEGRTFAIGPTTNRAFFDQGRESVEVDRGPCAFLYNPYHACLELTI